MVFLSYTFNKTSKKLVEDKEIQDYLITNYSIIELSLSVRCSILININYRDGNLNQISVNLTESIQTIKPKYKYNFNNENDDNFVFIFNGEQLDSNKAFQDYSISNFSTIFIQSSNKELNININNPNETLFLYNYDVNNKVNDVKLFIKEEMGIPIDEQKLFYLNDLEELDDRIPKFYAFHNYYTNTSLYHVPNGSSLIFVKLETNKRAILNVK